MKSIRIFSFVLVFVLVLAAWAPAAASPDPGAAPAAAPQTVSLTVKNQTLGILIVNLQSSVASYRFYAPLGRTTYQIIPGKYTYTLGFYITNLCIYFIPTLKYNTFLPRRAYFTSPQNTLGPYRDCGVRDK